jgi:hypothetical protein
MRGEISFHGVAVSSMIRAGWWQVTDRRPDG